MPAPNLRSDPQAKRTSALKSSSSDPSLSPRQQFQSRVRKLESNSPAKKDVANLETGKLSERSVGLQHVSSLRVQPERCLAMILESTPQNNSLQTHLDPVIGHKTPNTEPDFVIEERAAWSRKSPKTQENIRSHSGKKQDKVIPANIPPFNVPVLEPPSQRNGPLPQPRKQNKQNMVLRPFEPLRIKGDPDERPKTSHGPKPGMSGWPSDFLQGVQESSPPKSGRSSRRDSKKSKFLEGSMNERSVAIASTWCGHTPGVEDDMDVRTDADATPRPSRESQRPEAKDDDSTDNDTEIPIMQKRRLFKFRANPKPSLSESKGLNVSPRLVRKGLRKSMSIWNFHNLGDKMKGLSQSSIDLTKNAPENGTDARFQPQDFNVLDERKRKAEEAYAAQFGLKRQRSNNGLASSGSAGTLSSAETSHKPKTHGRRSLSGGHTYTPGPRSSVQGRETTGVDPDPVHQGCGDPNASRDNIDRRKRPSRRDLEKENQQLRELLRQSQNHTFAHNVSVQVAQELMRQREDVISMSPEKNFVNAGIPPLPTQKASKTDRRALVEVENVGATVRDSDNDLLDPLDHAAGKGKRRIVPTILEEDEPQPTGREPWEWPDDVF